MNFEETDEEVIRKGKRLANITFIVIGVFVVLVIIGICLIKLFFYSLFSKDCYVLKINNSNKTKIISLLENEGQKYCDTMYKIEYVQGFPKDKVAKIYCKDENDIEFTIIDGPILMNLLNIFMIRENTE